MNQYVKEFFHRGLLFGGFGPIILGIVYAIIDKSVDHFSLSGNEVLVAICSIYLLAFLQAGASVFHQIERLSMPVALLCHLSVLYFSYVFCYLINRWIPFEPTVLLIFTAVFLVSYFLVWGIVVVAIKITTKKLNRKLQEF